SSKAELSSDHARHSRVPTFLFFFKQPTAYGFPERLVGSEYTGQIVIRETAAYLGRHGNAAPFEPVVNVLFNENLRSEWFMPLNQLVGNATLLTILLVGAAVIREREHGTIEHLLVMPVDANEIVMAKILANGLIILVSSLLSLLLVVHRAVGVPING
ncbi:ABC transporter permease, partial [Campylobacter concisus]|uniref:ABC transporter permease n=1 Tax=Campylobacter concisus TaxID=199 RepID=UPI001C67E9EA